MLGEADLGLVYGDEAAVAAYAGRREVATRGPGRTKALLCDAPDESTMEHLAHAAAGDGGVRCGNVSVVLAADDAAAIADRLAERLASMPVMPPDHPDAVLPARELDEARQLDARVRELGGEDRSAPLYPDGPVADLGDGSAVLRPRVLLVDDSAHPAVGIELPLPFVVVAPWRPSLGTAPLRDSLVVALLGGDPEVLSDLAARAIREPTVKKVVRGHVEPWWTRPGLPHEDSLAAFLLAEKADRGGILMTPPDRGSHRGVGRPRAGGGGTAGRRRGVGAGTVPQWSRPAAFLEDFQSVRADLLADDGVDVLLSAVPEYWKGSRSSGQLRRGHGPRRSPSWRSRSGRAAWRST
jgi:hypothetical protein